MIIKQFFYGLYMVGQTFIVWQDHIDSRTSLDLALLWEYLDSDNIRVFDHKKHQSMG